jgi:hypothetical protein
MGQILCPIPPRIALISFGQRYQNKLGLSEHVIIHGTSMQILKARFRSRNEFMEAYQATPPPGTLFVATTIPLSEKQPVLVELDCDELPNKVLIRGS